MSENKKAENLGDIVIYQTADGETQIDVKFEDETVWLTQAQLCELYQTSKANVSEHIKNIFTEGELDENSVVRKFRTTVSDGKSYMTAYYNLNMIISLGYRIKSRIETHFRRWATERLKEYMIKGFALDDKRLKKLGGVDYWKELLDRIRDIRSSEKVMYRQVLDLYATSVDYDPKSNESIAFFKMVQNKLHYAAHGHTSAEVIYERAYAKVLEGSSNVSYAKAIEKAKAEYKKYQAKTLSPVEKAYLQIIKAWKNKQKTKSKRISEEYLGDDLRIRTY